MKSKRKKQGKQIPLRQLLGQLYPDESRDTLLSWVLCGDVLVDGVPCREPARLVPVQGQITRRRKRFVSRGGEKLQAALEAWRFPVEGRVFLDAGASTGGFTDVLLQAGAAGVHAVDVGWNQLDWKLRQDSRVFVHEKTNIMALGGDALDPAPQAATADLSFRSLRGAAAHILKLVSEGWMIALMKPQFEWQDPDEDFDGVVSSPEVRARLLAEVTEALDREGIGVRQWMESPLHGRRGNCEYLLWLEKKA